eukprot:scaffold44411_cov45-Attheya_sp.AAC.2
MTPLPVGHQPAMVGFRFEYIQKDYDPSHNGFPNNDEYIIYIHHKTSNTTIPYPLLQAKELFPAAVAWHIMWTSGRQVAHPRFGDRKLAWAVNFWDTMTAPSNPECISRGIRFLEGRKILVDVKALLIRKVLLLGFCMFVTVAVDRVRKWMIQTLVTCGSNTEVGQSTAINVRQSRAINVPTVGEYNSSTRKSSEQSREAMSMVCGPRLPCR